MRTRFFLAVSILAVLLHAASFSAGAMAGSGSGHGPVKTITDMAGRTVILPDRISKVVTLGPVPVINSFLFALGEGEKIVNGLPGFARAERFKYQMVLAPAIKNRPVMQGPGNEPEVEVILKSAPDIVFTMNARDVALLEEKGIPVVFLAWRQPEDVVKVIDLMGGIFGKEEKAAEYVDYFNSTLKRVIKAADSIPHDKRPTVLFCDLKRFTQPHLIAEWWIGAAGGLSVTDDGRKAESMTFSLEQMLKWDPEIIVVMDPKDMAKVYEDGRYSGIKAVRDRRVYVAPTGAMVWSNRTAELPLTLLWASRIFHPGRFGDMDMKKEMRDFYKRFFGYRMSDSEAESMLGGRILE